MALRTDLRSRVVPPIPRAPGGRPGLLAGILAFLLAFAFLGALLSPPVAAFPSKLVYDVEMATYGYGPVILTDLNGDTRLDILAGDAVGGGIYAYYQGEGGGFSGPVFVAYASPPAQILLVRDVTRDGRGDLVAASDGGVSLYRGTSNGFEAAAYTVLNASDVRDLGVTDLDGDGLPDVAVLTAEGVGLWFQREGTYAANASITLDDKDFKSLVLADLTGDGPPELVIARSQQIHLYAFVRTEGTIPEIRRSMYTLDGAGGQIRALAEAVDGDGRTDLVFVEYNPETARGRFTAWRWTGDGFANLTAVDGPFTTEAAFGDLNDDGQKDLVVLAPGGDVQVYFLGGPGILAPTPDLVLSPGTGMNGRERVATGDLNGDGYDDLLLRTTEDASLRIYLQEDLPVRLIQAVPSGLVVQENTAARGLVDARNFFQDDHGKLAVGVAYEERPNRLQVDVSGTLVSFVPARGWYGTARFALWGWDGVEGHPKVVSNNFTVLVNDVPSITSTPPTKALGGQTYRYEVQVADVFPSDDRPTFELLRGPSGMEVDQATGLLRWTPPAEAEGAFDVAIRVRDAYGGVSEIQSFRLVVASTALPAAALIAVGGALTVGTLAAVAILANENLKWAFLLFILPLYSKIKRERVLDHFRRGQIYGYIVANPGEHYNAIKNALRVTNGSLAHHLKTLERENFIKSKRFGLYRRFYPANYRIPEEGEFRLNEVQKNIVGLLRERPGLSQKEIADALGVSPPTVNYHVTILADRGLLRILRRGRRTMCYVVEEGGS
jgi:predicted transcriptional regulator